MAEQGAGERTEEPTPKRLEDARAKGDVPRSRELDVAIGLVAGLAGLALLGPAAVRRTREAAVRLWSLPRDRLLDPATLPAALLGAIGDAVLGLLPFLALTGLAAFAGSALVGGIRFTAPKLDPKRLDPIKGIGRMFSAKSLGELVKAIAKVVLFVVVGWLVAVASFDGFLALGRAPLEAAVASSFRLVFALLVALTVVMALIAAADVPWQKLQHTRKLRMTLEQVKRERRESEGSPETKSRVRGEQTKASRRRMLADVASASVIVTNPTHYAVALRYRDGDRAPVVVARGHDELAARIRAIGADAGVATFSAPPLARALYRHVRLGEPVRVELWEAVARVLAFVMQLEASVADARAARPVPPSARELAVPASLERTAPR